MQAIRDRENQIVASLVSLWEITIKISKGGLPQLGSSIQYLPDEVREQRFELLHLRPEHLLVLGRVSIPRQSRGLYCVSRSKRLVRGR